MVGDYIATSLLAGQQRAIGLFAAATAPTSTGVFNEPMFAAPEDVGGGTMPTTESTAVITGTSNSAF